MTSPAVQRDVVIVSCAISAGIHVALTPEHLRERVGAGLGFLGSAVVLAGLCAALTRRPQSPVPVALAALVLAGLIVAYALALTTGVPVLHPSPEPADGLGLATKAVEAAGLVAALRLLVPARPVVRLTRLRLKGLT